MKLIIIKLAFVTLGLIFFFSPNFLISTKKAAECVVAQKCVGSIFTSCSCPDGDCQGCLRVSNGRGCGVCSKCKVKN